MHEPVIRTGDHILVGDGEKALLFENRGSAFELRFQIVALMHHSNPPTREQGTDKPGRYSDGNSGHASAMEQTDWHRIEKQRFAGEVINALQQQYNRGLIERLHIVAPPRALGSLREAMPRNLRTCVVSELDKDLTGHPVSAIEQNLRKTA